MKNFKRAGAALILASASACVSAGQLPDTENMQGLQFNFSNPGARSLGTGGAFLGRADDATAAFANPAGLTNLFYPEISAEYRHTEYTTSYTQAGPYPDNLQYGNAKDSVDNLSYLSYVHPFNEKFVLAVYRHELMNFKTSFSADAMGVFVDGVVGDYLATDNYIDTSIESYGLSSAYRVNDKISLGASFVYYDFSKDAYTDRLFESSVSSSQIQTGNDSAWGVTLGALFTFTERLSLGLVYRSMPKFDTQHQVVADEFVEVDKNYDFEVPDVYGAGLSFQASENLTLNFDVVRVDYSSLTSPIFYSFASTETPVNEPAFDGEFGIEDGTEIHFGAEYVLSSKFAIRAGVWTDPAHVIEYKGPVTNIDEGFADANFQGSKDQTHLSFGFGYVFGTKGQIDFAADFSDYQDVYSASAVFRFE